MNSDAILNKMPAFFIGHGSPMNAIEDNEFTKVWQDLAQKIPLPKSILCISAHWETDGTYITGMDNPKTIHDFGGFPQQLFDVQYNAPGNNELATYIKSKITKTDMLLDFNRWGLDHGTWSILNKMYPSAEIPVIQLSLNKSLTFQQHYELAQELSFLRNEGIMIIGSGNWIHNLSLLDWKYHHASYDWAGEINELIKKCILIHDHDTLINFQKNVPAFKLAIPTPEHFLPLLYILALQNKNEEVTIFNDQIIMGSLNMTGVKIG